jgi:flavodoxin
MKYEIAYLSNSGNTAKLAQELVGMLSREEVSLTDLACDQVSADADVYLFGFGVNRGTVPVKIMDALECAEGKTILLFVTCGLEPTKDYQASIERRIMPFLPDECDYKGLFLCQGQFQEEAVKNLQKALQQQPENEQIRALLNYSSEADGHPDRNDLNALAAFVSAQLLT